MVEYTGILFNIVKCQLYHSKNRIVIWTINLLSSLQTSELRCMDRVNCQDGMIMWRKVG